MIFKEIALQELKLNPALFFTRDWPLLSAGNEQDGCNSMTIGWGHLGAVWSTEAGRGAIPTAEVFVRPQRYTNEFMKKEQLFTISVLPESFKKALGYMGSHSGRDEDKIKNAGLTPLFIDGTVCIEEAELVLICRKIYHSAMTKEAFIDGSIVSRDYPQGDFHEIYIGEIIKALQK